MVLKETEKEPILNKIYLKGKWPSNQKVITDDLKFFIRRNSLLIVNGCLMYENRLVIPQIYRKRIIHQIHKGHPGEKRIKSLARYHVYWPILVLIKILQILFVLVKIVL